MTAKNNVMIFLTNKAITKNSHKYSGVELASHSCSKHTFPPAVNHHKPGGLKQYKSIILMILEVRSSNLLPVG